MLCTSSVASYDVGLMSLRSCGPVVLWSCGLVVLWASGSSVLRSCGLRSQVHSMRPLILCDEEICCGYFVALVERQWSWLCFQGLGCTICGLVV